jgi:hypothetical protein
MAVELCETCGNLLPGSEPEAFGFSLICTCEPIEVMRKKFRDAEKKKDVDREKKFKEERERGTPGIPAQPSDHAH